MDAARSCWELVPPQERALSPSHCSQIRRCRARRCCGFSYPWASGHRPGPSLALGFPWRPGLQEPSLLALPRPPKLSPASRVFAAHTGVCVSPAHSGCRPRWTPAAAPCGWKRRARPEGQAWSRPGPSGAVVRASLCIGPGLAGRVAREVLWGPPPLPDAQRASGCREVLSYVERVHASVLKLFGGFRGPAACSVLLPRLCPDFTLALTRVEGLLHPQLCSWGPAFCPLFCCQRVFVSGYS